jgi:hypothetical protein
MYICIYISVYEIFMRICIYNFTYMCIWDIHIYIRISKPAKAGNWHSKRKGEKMYWDMPVHTYVQIL